MRVIYNIGSEAIETVYTYDEWLKEYNRRETKRRIRQRTEHLYYMKQRLSGTIMAAMGILTPLSWMEMEQFHCLWCHWEYFCY